MIVFGILFVILGISYLLRSISSKKIYQEIKQGKNKDYKKIVGVVTCNAYHMQDSTNLNKAVTPIVEYEVNGEKYETQNSILETGAELPVGTKVYVWYKKDDPKIAILGTELGSPLTMFMMGFVCIILGILVIYSMVMAELQ